MIDPDQLPRILYGTAWKEGATSQLTELALLRGFRAIDTANQRKHYHEAAVGAGIAASIQAGRVRRDDLFLQTKFTYRRGQDHRLPYDPRSSLTVQVRQSFERSLQHLQLGSDGRLDSLLLHAPASRDGWTDDDREVWAAMETLHDDGRVRFLGVSNVAPAHLHSLLDEARIPPTMVQNRCYARLGWDAAVRALCRGNGLVYQGFSLLTANRRELAHPAIAAVALRRGLTIPQLVFRAAEPLGILPLTGTTSSDHMALDLAALDAPALTEDDLATIEGIGLASP